MRCLRSASCSSLAWNWNGRIEVSPVGSTVAPAPMKGRSALATSGFDGAVSGVRVGAPVGVVGVFSTDMVDLLVRARASSDLGCERKDVPAGRADAAVS